jgi:hypothetical protein
LTKDGAAQGIPTGFASWPAASAILLTAIHGALTLAMDNLAGSGSFVGAEDALAERKLEAAQAAFDFRGRP